MSQIAIIEITDCVIDYTKIKDICFYKDFYFDVDNLIKLNFFRDEKLYIDIFNDVECKELDMLIFDYKIDLNDYKKIYDVISPLFYAVTYLINNGIETNKIKLFIAEDCNLTEEEFIKINIDCTNFEKSFIDYISSHDIIQTNCFPPIAFSFI